MFLPKFLLLVSGIVLLSCNFCTCSEASPVPKVAIIGGGIGGTATSYFLTQLFGAGKVDIDIYEARQIGGRLATVDVAGRNYETGGSIIHPRNKYMVSFVKTFGLKPRENAEGSLMGLWDGSKFVFEESSWHPVTVLKMLWRYGYGIFKLNSYIDDMLTKFESIYSLQNKGEAFWTVGDMLKAMNPQFESDRRIKSGTGFKKLGFSELLVDEIVAATIRVNYGQDLLVHKFVGSVSVAGATGNLWSVDGGNFRVAEKLLEASEAQLVRDRVVKVSTASNGKLIVRRQGTSIDGDRSELSRVYDIVVLASPLQTNSDSSIDLSEYPDKGWAGPYHHTVSTVLQEDSSPTSPASIKVWKSDLYRLQLEAPSAKCVHADGPVPGRPSQFGGEFHGVLSHQDALRLLTENGAYLVRLSAGNDGFHTLSLRFNNKVSHYKLYYDGQFYVRASDKRYDSVKELVADGLVTLHMEQHAAHYIERMHQHSYEQSPYMTLNKLKRRALKKHSTRKQQIAAVDGLPVGERKSALSEAIAVSTEAEGLDLKSHSFRVHTFKGLNWCELCGNFLWGFTAQGVKCEDCGFSAHNRCSEKVPPDCQPDFKNLRGVFGLDLATLVKAHRSQRPWVLDKCIAEMEKRGLTSEGLYRVSGFQDEIASLKLALDRDGEQADISPQAYDNINVIAGTLKLYLRLLPIPLITFEAHPALMKAAQAESLQLKLRGIKDALSLLPAPHFYTLKYFVEHLHRVAQLHELNKMTSHNLSTVLAPTLMPTPDLTLFTGSIPAMVDEITSLEHIISYHDSIFD